MKTMDIKEAEKSLKLNRAINTFKNAEYQLKQTEMQRMNHSTAATPTPKASLPALPTLPGIPTVVPATPPSPLRVTEPPQDDPDEAPLPAPKVEVEADVENPTSNSATSATTGLDSQTSSSVEGNSSAADAPTNVVPIPPVAAPMTSLNSAPEP